MRSGRGRFWESGRGSLADLRLSQIFFVRRDRPFMPERIRQLSVAVPPKHVLHGCLRGRSGGNCPFEGGIHVFDIEKNAHRSPVQSLRRPRAHLWDLVGEHDDGIANLNLSVHDLAARAGHAEAFKGTEGALVKVKSACGVAHHQIGSHRVETFWNGLHFSWHVSSSLDLGRSCLITRMRPKASSSLTCRGGEEFLLSNL